MSWKPALMAARSSFTDVLERPTEAEMRCEGVILSGSLYDISLGGFSIRAEHRCPFDKGVEVKLRVMVPNLLQDTLTGIDTAACHLETISEGEQDLCRFSFEADAQSETTISRFIFQRQVEIIREIKEGC